MITQAQAQAMIAGGIPLAQVMALMQGGGANEAAAPVAVDQALNAIRSAPPPSEYDDSFSDDGGKFDGRYRVRVRRVFMMNTRKSGNIFKVAVTVLASSNPYLTAGSNREHPVFIDRAEAALSEAQGLIQKLWAAKGGQGPYTDQFAKDVIGEGQPAAGLEFDLEVSTSPQSRDKMKNFTHVTFSPVQGAAPAVSAPAGFPATAGTSGPAVTPVVNPLAGLDPALLALLGQAAPAAPVGPTLPPELMALFAAQGAR